MVLVDWTYVNNTEAALVASVPMSGRAQIIYAQVHGQKRVGNRAVQRGLHEALRADLHGTGVRSCHLVLGKVSSEYFQHNPGAEERIPAISRTIPTLTPEECARIIARLMRRPRAQAVYPFMLRMYYWMSLVFPGAVRTLLRVTGYRSRD